MIVRKQERLSIRSSLDSLKFKYLSGPKGSQQGSRFRWAGRRARWANLPQKSGNDATALCRGGSRLLLKLSPNLLATKQQHETPRGKPVAS